MSDLPAINQDAIDHIFVSLVKMEIKLEENPLEYGPRHFNMKTAQARRFLADTESLFLKVSSWIQKYKAAHRVSETLLELNKKNLYTNDPETRAGRNFSDREAIASVKLRSDVEELSRMVSVLEDLGAVITAIKSKRADLKDIQGRIRDQIKLCQEEIGLGGRWGSRPPPGVKAPELPEGPKPESLRDLKNLFESSRSRPAVEDLLEDAVLSKGLEDLEFLAGDTQFSTQEAQLGQDPENDSQEDPLSHLFDDEPAPEEVAPPPEPPQEKVVGILKILEDVENGLGESPQIGFCQICGKPQFNSFHGPVCENGHGGAPTIHHPLQGSSSDVEVDSLLEKVDSSEPKKQELDIDSILGEFGFD